MAEIENQETWVPFSIFFSLGRMTVSFPTREQFNAWLSGEKSFWAQYTSHGNLSGSATQNVRYLNAFNDNPTIEAVKLNFDNIKERFLPSMAVSWIFQGRDVNTALAALNEVISPGGGQQFNPVQAAEIKCLATIFKTIGSPQILGDQIVAAQVEIEKIRVSDAAVLQRFEHLVATSEADWKTRIQGYEAKVDLSAPRKYWEDRATKHDGLAKNAGRWWQGGLIVLVLAVVLSAHQYGDKLFNLAVISPSEIAALIGRVFVISTILGFSVWWLKQKLRDFRSHEHLAEDAAERVTMIETYAAMKGGGLIVDDLAPILTALYRPASTGMIDDSGPLLPIEVLMKSVGDVAGRKT